MENHLCLSSEVLCCSIDCLSTAIDVCTRHASVDFIIIKRIAQASPKQLPALGHGIMFASSTHANARSADAFKLHMLQLDTL